MDATANKTASQVWVAKHFADKLTPGQQAAVDSGITGELVSKIGTAESQAEEALSVAQSAKETADKKMDVVDGATPGNVAVFDDDGHVVDSGVAPGGEGNTYVYKIAEEYSEGEASYWLKDQDGNPAIGTDVLEKASAGYVIIANDGFNHAYSYAGDSSGQIIFYRTDGLSVSVCKAQYTRSSLVMSQYDIADAGYVYEELAKKLYKEEAASDSEKLGGREAKEYALEKDVSQKRGIDDLAVYETEPANEHWTWTGGSFEWTKDLVAHLNTYGAEKPRYQPRAEFWVLTLRDYDNITAEETDGTGADTVVRFSLRNLTTGEQDEIVCSRSSATDVREVLCNPLADGTYNATDDSLAKESQLPTQVSQLSNDVGFITNEISGESSSLKLSPERVYIGQEGNSTRYENGKISSSGIVRTTTLQIPSKDGVIATTDDIPTEIEIATSVSAGDIIEEIISGGAKESLEDTVAQLNAKVASGIEHGTLPEGWERNLKESDVIEVDEAEEAGKAADALSVKGAIAEAKGAAEAAQSTANDAKDVADLAVKIAEENALSKLAVSNLIVIKEENEETATSKYKSVTYAVNIDVLHNLADLEIEDADFNEVFQKIVGSIPQEIEFAHVARFAELTFGYGWADGSGGGETMTASFIARIGGDISVAYDGVNVSIQEANAGCSYTKTGGIECFSGWTFGGKGVGYKDGNSIGYYSYNCSILGDGTKNVTLTRIAGVELADPSTEPSASGKAADAMAVGEKMLDKTTGGTVNGDMLVNTNSSDLNGVGLKYEDKFFKFVFDEGLLVLLTNYNGRTLGVRIPYNKIVDEDIELAITSDIADATKLTPVYSRWFVFVNGTPHPEFSVTYDKGNGEWRYTRQNFPMGSAAGSEDDLSVDFGSGVYATRSIVGYRLGTEEDAPILIEATEKSVQGNKTYELPEPIKTALLSTTFTEQDSGKAADAAAVAKELAKKRSLDDMRVPKTEPKNVHWVCTAVRPDYQKYVDELNVYGAGRPYFDGGWVFPDIKAGGTPEATRPDDEYATKISCEWKVDEIEGYVVAEFTRDSATDTTPVPCHPRADGSFEYEDESVDRLAKKSDIVAKRDKTDNICAKNEVGEWSIPAPIVVNGVTHSFDGKQPNFDYAEGRWEWFSNKGSPWLAFDGTEVATSLSFELNPDLGGGHEFSSSRVTIAKATESYVTPTGVENLIPKPTTTIAETESGKAADAAAVASLLSGITSQDIDDFLNYKGEVESITTDSQQNGDVYYLKQAVGGVAKGFWRREDSPSCVIGDSGWEFVYDKNYGKTGLEKLIYLFGSENKHLGQTITTSAEAAVRDIYDNAEEVRYPCYENAEITAY